jgi:hypothetical protein
MAGRSAETEESVPEALLIPSSPFPVRLQSEVQHSPETSN